MSATAALLDFAEAPPPLVPMAEAAISRLLRDTLAVGVAGASHPDAAAVLAAARGWGAGDDAPVLGTPGVRLPAPSAAFVNGFRIHCLEWDAVHEAAVVHALSAVTAAVHALAHREQIADRGALFAAAALGVEAACLLGVAATSPLRFFRPATAGAVGAALACARLLDLPRARLAHALALAVAQAAGTMQAHVEGSIALPLQVGFAARAGVVAADLAAAGLTGPGDPLEGQFGYFPLFDAGALAPHVGGLGTRVEEVSIKPWPCGRASHGVLDALSRAGEEAAGMADIEAHVPPLVMRLVGRPFDAGLTPARARLCLPFLVALMLRDGRIDPRAFTDASFNDAQLVGLGERLQLLVDGNPDPNALVPQRVMIRRFNQATMDVALPAVLGHPAAPLSPDQLQAKIAFALELGGMPAGRDPLDLLTVEE